MEVFKFGGASVKDATGVRNVVKVLENQGFTKKAVVISAMGKTTNALEEVITSYFDASEKLADNVNYVLEYHLEISKELFENLHPVHQKIKNFIADLEIYLERNKSKNYNYVYDQVIAYGELIGTTIVSDYLLSQGMGNVWMDARKLIKTDSNFRGARVNWKLTEKLIKTYINSENLTVTQGFIASDEDNNFTTTLGREGSDYTAGILAYCLEAEDVTIWKDVDGVLNADPRVFSETTLLENISYHEAIELAFYGASVIHPKTLQPLQRKDIPLFVKCFAAPQNDGTTVKSGPTIYPEVPCFIVKKNLILLSLSTLDFSFFVEENISEVFALFHRYRSKVHLIQNSAISFSVCIDNKFHGFDDLIEILSEEFEVSYNKNVCLYTVRHFSDNIIRSIKADKSILLEQRTRETAQLIIEEE